MSNLSIFKDLDKIPDEIFSIQQWECTVKSNENVATFIKELVLQLPDGENLNFKAGGFIQINIPEYELDFNEDEITHINKKYIYDKIDEMAKKIKNMLNNYQFKKKIAFSIFNCFFPFRVVFI